jgi:hypothetical protein
LWIFMSPAVGDVRVLGPEKAALFFGFEWHRAIMTNRTESVYKPLIVKKRGHRF